MYTDMVRPISTEALQEICEDIAQQNYGFVYIPEHKKEIKERYEQTDNGIKYKSSLELSDIKNGMQKIADDDFNSFQRLRGDSFFINPLEKKWGQKVSEELEEMFAGDIVLHKKRLESKFDIAPTDVDFFAQKLIDEEYITRVPAGERDYFVGGPELKDESKRDVGLDAQLKSRANPEGKLSHRELEEIIDVAATENVIDYLSQNDFIIDLDGEYLVQAALDEFSESQAERIEEDVAEEFQESHYVLHEREFKQVVENKLNERSDILKQARSVRRELLERTENALTDSLGLEREKDMWIMYSDVVDDEGFEDFLEKQASSIQKQVTNSDVTITQRSDHISAGKEMISELQVGRTERSKEFIQAKVEEKYESLVDEEWGSS